MEYTGELSALLTAILWSGTAIAFASASQLVGSLQINISRLILAAVFLILSILLLQIPVQLSLSQVIFLSLSGLVGLAFGDTFLFRAFKEIGARISMLIMSLVPAISAVLAWVFLGEDLGVRTMTGILVTIVGITGVVFERGKGRGTKLLVTWSGVFYAFLGALGQAGGLILAKFAFNEGEIHGLVATCVRLLVALALMYPVSVALRRYRNPVSVFRSNPRAFLYTLVGSVLGPFLGITFSLVAIAHTNVGVAATIMALPPVIMLPLVRWIYREELPWRAIVGAFVAVAGVAILFLR